MSFRVWDKKRKKWVNDDIYLNPDGELFQPNKKLFGNRLTFVSQNRYVYQKSIELQDMNGQEIYIGDYVEAQVADNKTICGVVIYAEELSSYIIICFSSDEYYALGSQVSSYLRVVGNVFEDFFDKSIKEKYGK